ncbi:MAG: 30S ribosomal protein S11 [Verrucomicrobiota bacterium]
MADEEKSEEEVKEEAAAPVEEAAPEAAEAKSEEEAPAAAAEGEAEAAPAAEKEAPSKEEAPAAEGGEEKKPEGSGDEKPAAEGEKSEKSEEGGDRPKDARPQSKVDEVFMSLEGGDSGKPKILKAKGSKNVHAGIVHVQATFNNTIVTVTDVKGNVIGWSTSGKLGFRGSRKSTAYAAQLVSQDACRQAMSHGLRQAEVRVKGPGSGRDSAVRAVQAIGIDVILIKDVTPIPHNGCRPPKARRV